jgi:hypothetical protein
VTSLPTRFLLGPEMADFGFSVAGVALADGDAEIKAALPELLKALIGVRTAFDGARAEFRKFESSLDKAPAGTLPGFLDNFSALESTFAKACDRARRLAGPKFQSLLYALAESQILGELNAFVGETRRDYIPTIRHLRMLIIKIIYLRAEASGVSDVRLDPDFEESFMAASPQEADSWQETAYLMWHPENLSRLIASSKSQIDDRSEEYSQFIEASRSR